MELTKVYENKITNTKLHEGGELIRLHNSCALPPSSLPTTNCALVTGFYAGCPLIILFKIIWLQQVIASEFPFPCFMHFRSLATSHPFCYMQSASISINQESCYMKKSACFLDDPLGPLSAYGGLLEA